MQRLENLTKPTSNSIVPCKIGRLLFSWSRNTLLLWISNDHHCVYRVPLLDLIQNQLNPVHNVTPYFYNIRFDIILPFKG